MDKAIHYTQMETTVLHKDLIDKRQKLQTIANTLKERFIGLDNVIDEMIATVMPWYLFPEAQLRPTVINLWGLTGSGKTALVQALVELLNHQKLYSHIDMGEFESDSAKWMKKILTDDLAFFHDKPAIICLDEFQFARTLDADDKELGKDKLRVVWDLLDTGKIEYTPNYGSFYLFRAESGLRRLERALKSDVQLEQGKVVSGKDTFLKIFEGFYFDDGDAPMTADYFTSEDFIDGMYYLFDNDEYSKEYIRQRIKAGSLAELLAFVFEGMESRSATKTLDLSRAFIFVLGNLDEAYAMSRNMNPDINADEFHEQTGKITIAHIKRALRKRFRAEQIARLGNNHVIYKSFNSAQFRQLIQQELSRVGDFIQQKFGWKITFDDSVVNVVYAEGVFPAQGTRPVLTTVKNLIESRISNLAVSILEYQWSVHEIVWAFHDTHFVYTLKDHQGETVSSLSDKARLKLENLRKSVDPELQAHTAVHEAGHAVLAALTLRIVPSVVVSRTASEAEGFCLVNFPKGPVTRETLKKDIVITLGGYVAERIVFGEEMTCSGVSADIEEASSLANKAVRQYAMGSDPIFLAVENTLNEDAFFLSERYATEAIKIIRDGENEAEKILLRNKLLLLKMAEYLTKHSKMEEALIAEYVMKYGKESWLESEGLIKKDQYYRFNTVMEEQLRALESNEAETVMEELIAEVTRG
ncbi:cell division protease FtsH [Chryseolinea serpens]|uniref:Cell division protease FtsH n=2 Tax=Chryseolinea serpens TaxID=947013 RepID=A0A1M5P7P9_9BACT|nr:cell division protease FtsH [Chryseolinea serpens]